MNLFDTLTVDPHRDLTLASQLKQQLTWLIANGQLRPGDRLPSVQAMAARLGINLHTVRSAYQKLEAEGLVESRPGRGTHVMEIDPRRLGQPGASVLSHTIGVILPSWTNPFYHAFLQGVEEISDQDGSLLFLCNTHDDPSEAWRDFVRLSARQVDGILVVSHDIYAYLEGPDAAYQAGIPFVTVDWPGCPGYSLEIDLESAGYQATCHLLSLGRRRIGLITYAVDLPNTSPVNAGYQRALQEAGLEIDPNLIARVAGFDLPSGVEGARQLLSRAQPPDGIFAIADLLAISVIQVAKQAGLGIPADLAVAGFNDIPLAALVDPPLTSVAVPAVQLGREAMKMLKSLITGKRPARRRIVLPVSLAVRNSSYVQPADAAP